MNRTAESLRTGHVTTVAPAAVEPVTVSEANEWMRLPTDVEDSRVAALITAARQQAESITRRTIAPATLKLELPRFPIDGRGIELRRGPVNAVTALSYENVVGDEVSLDVEQDLVSVREADQVYVFPKAGCWPTNVPGAGETAAAVEVTYTAGQASVPEQVKTAILLLVAHHFENREATSPLTLKAVPMGVDALLAPFTDHRI